jgi:hypothetical protein
VYKLLGDCSLRMSEAISPTYASQSAAITWE